jgi:hypothetical protein
MSGEKCRTCNGSGEVTIPNGEWCYSGGRNDPGYPAMDYVSCPDCGGKKPEVQQEMEDEPDSELSALRKELEEVKKEHQDYIRLTRGNFNTLWHRLGQVHQELCMRPDAKEIIEGIILEAREIADYCVNHGSTEKHAEFKDLKQAMETEASLRTQLEKANDEASKFREIFLKEHSKTCVHHTDAEREVGCPVCLNRKLEKTELQRDNLLCRIHRDGGHYLQSHGIDKACADADVIVATMNAEADTNKEKLEKAREVLKPFVAIAEMFSGLPPSTPGCLKLAKELPITLGDCRKAKEFLEGKNFANLENSKSGDGVAE